MVVRDGFKVGHASKLRVGGVPVLFLAAELGQRPAKSTKILVDLLKFFIKYTTLVILMLRGISVCSS